MSSIIERSDSLNTRVRREREALAMAEEAVTMLDGIFDRFPASRDGSGRPAKSFRVPRFTTTDGVLIQLDRTNYNRSDKGVYNVSIVDENNVFHGYAQLWRGTERINYWDPRNHGSRIAGSTEQDSELLGILRIADETVVN